MTEISKTLSAQESTVWIGLQEMGKTEFQLDDAQDLLGLQKSSTNNLVQRMLKKGVITRLHSGLYSLVPFELGRTNTYMPNPYLVARAIVRQKLGEKAQYAISHASAMEIHQMTTQPQFIVYTTTTKQIKIKSTISGTEFRFITAKPEHHFGVKKVWIDNSEKVYVSDLEKTVIDGLKMPEHCGGITEVAKGLWMKRDEIKLSKLFHYAEKMNIGAIYRRLGFILDTYQMLNEEDRVRLQTRLSKTYMLLDPTLPNEGKHISAWRLKVNIEPSELTDVVRT